MPNAAITLSTIDPSRAQSLPELAYRELREAIISGRVTPDTVLTQERIASQLGISRLPVREALRRLEAEGLVLSRPRRGFVVASVRRSEVIDIFELRAVLEARAGMLATMRRTEEDVVELRRILEEMEDALNERTMSAEQFAELNGQFHGMLSTPDNRPHLARAVRVARGAGERYTRMSVALSEDLAPSAKEHRQIFDAYAEGDAKRVAKLCEAHCIATGQRLVANLKLNDSLNTVSPPLPTGSPQIPMKGSA
ncbi:MAG: GntR family transcriptional regulator [Azospirillaceae bacterium]